MYGTLTCLLAASLGCPIIHVEAEPGTEGGICLPRSQCNAELVCLAGRCQWQGVLDAGQVDAAGQDRMVRADAGPAPDSGCDPSIEGHAACEPQCGSSGECPLDILFVVDNSASMAEEQERLASAVGDLITKLDARDNRYQIGVLSTDLNDCDSPWSGATRGSVPQRGCLQTSQLDPSLAVISWETADATSKLASIIRNVGTWGSAYEKGLGALMHFLTPGHDVPAHNACGNARDCSGDLSTFLRDSARNSRDELVDTRLLIVFLTDEDDCTHGGAIDEAASGNTDLCYNEPDRLTRIAPIVTSLQSRKRSPELISVALIAGLFDDGSGMHASGCKLLGSSASNDCDPVMGNSVANCTQCVDGQPICPCHPALVCPDGTEHPATNCCQADPATRYEQLAQDFQSHALESICGDDYSAAITHIVDQAL